MQYTIRKMQLEDIPHVQNVAKVSWNATYKGIIPIHVQEKFLKYAYNDEMMQRRYERSFIFVAEVEGKVIGFANFSPLKENGEAELGAIYLYPEYQGEGIGTALLNEGIKYLEGVKEIYINVEKDNIIGKNFYHAKGFEVVSEFVDHFEGYDLKTVRMVLQIEKAAS
ncbi:GNAT family acetyltransferase [Heyndrickxia shackletonii]|uniref:GNAT family acetyltransferase n=1 Tax=Heyndrickxia shackletonii TaxID=157838 RepID=A0A0Q3WV28_9BACI|nr:GNAT family N-acetyltransferase [Heyndrickxia shackletonii]KQL52307.1 GNAT family acetyltransferase [Heyndrickxia shackletonii]NEZ00327.1 GNAT family N-acetyltransferase [Heyndrickxia shackletonii]